eukprot:UN26285
MNSNINFQNSTHRKKSFGSNKNKGAFSSSTKKSSNQFGTAKQFGNSSSNLKFGKSNNSNKFNKSNNSNTNFNKFNNSTSNFNKSKSFGNSHKSYSSSSGRLNHGEKRKYGGNQPEPKRSRTIQKRDAEVSVEIVGIDPVTIVSLKFSWNEELQKIIKKVGAWDHQSRYW